MAVSGHVEVVDIGIAQVAPQPDQVLRAQDIGAGQEVRPAVRAAAEQACALLVELARKRQHVVRLKGGDPYIFGRGGEEALVLARRGIAFEVVPGITAAQACAAYAGIPLTHCGLAHGVQFLTGQRRENATLELDRASLCDPNQTLVIYMGLGHVDEIVHGLVAAGRAQNTPAAIVERGSTARQRSIVTALADLPGAVRRHGVEPPALLIIGAVVALAGELDWFLPWLEEAELKYA